jgi:pimeloyl-ACP methyl ester carboxylesterase
MVNEWWSHVEAVWEFERPATFLRRMSSLARVVHFDGRGGGMSDPVSPDTRLTLEGWTDDALAVLNAAGLGRVVVFGQGNGAALAVLLAATNPDRVSKLILHNANMAWAETSMAGTIGADAAKEGIMARWGSGPGLPIAPSLDSDESFGTWFGRWQRLAVSPGQLPLRLEMVVDTDVRPAEAAVAVPTLVLHAEGNRIVPLSAAQRLASSIGDARLVVLAGEDHLWCSGDREALFDAVGAFLAEPDREPAGHAELATALVAKVGAAPDRFGEALARVVAREGGTLHPTGGRLLAVFDGPVRAVACAVAIADMAQHQGVAFAAAAHTGLAERGHEGPSGAAVSVAGALCTRAEEGEVLLTRTVVDLIAGSGLEVRERGTLAMKGYDGGTFAVTTL